MVLCCPLVELFLPTKLQTLEIFHRPFCVRSYLWDRKILSNNLRDIKHQYVYVMLDENDRYSMAACREDMITGKDGKSRIGSQWLGQEVRPVVVSYHGRCIRVPYGVVCFVFIIVWVVPPFNSVQAGRKLPDMYA